MLTEQIRPRPRAGERGVRAVQIPRRPPQRHPVPPDADILVEITALAPGGDAVGRQRGGDARGAGDVRAADGAGGSGAGEGGAAEGPGGLGARWCRSRRASAAAGGAAVSAVRALRGVPVAARRCGRAAAAEGGDRLAGAGHRGRAGARRWARRSATGSGPGWRRASTRTGRPALGFRARRSHAIVDVPACPLLAPPAAAALPVLRQLAVDRELAPGDELVLQAGRGPRGRGGGGAVWAVRACAWRSAMTGRHRSRPAATPPRHRRRRRGRLGRRLRAGRPAVAHPGGGLCPGGAGGERGAGGGGGAGAGAAAGTGAGAARRVGELHPAAGVPGGLGDRQRGGCPGGGARAAERAPGRLAAGGGAARSPARRHGAGRSPARGAGRASPDAGRRRPAVGWCTCRATRRRWPATPPGCAAHGLAPAGGPGAST